MNSIDEGEDKRRFSRVGIGLRANAFFGDVVCGNLETSNLSFKGVFLQGVNASLSGEGEVEVFLDGIDPPIKVRVNARVVHQNDDGLGIEFLSVDASGYDHLKNLIRYNANNLEKVEKEMERPDTAQLRFLNH